MKQPVTLEDFDFGFSLVTADELTEPAVTQAKTATDQAEYWKQKTLDLRKMIMPLLNNLMKDPEKEYIKWPNRIEKIEQFIKRMDAHCEL